MFSKIFAALVSSPKIVPLLLSKAIWDNIESGGFVDTTIKRMTRLQILRYAKRVLLLQIYGVCTVPIKKNQNKFQPL